MLSKGDAVLALFFNEPSRHWSFSEVIERGHISRPQASRWLKHFEREGLIRRVKPRGRMPYYVGDHENPAYQGRKRLFALEQLEATGTLRDLIALPNAKTVILFGSMARWDWHGGSDIDLFVYGDVTGLDIARLRKNLHRPVEVFSCPSPRDLKSFNPALLRSVLEGYIIKGKRDFLEVSAHA